MSIDLSLSRLSNLLPHLPFTRPTVHIAGTNGKGSVSALVASILLKSGFRVGRFNSPHLVHITDCILINEVPVSNEDYLRTKELVIKTDREHGGGRGDLTPFEVLTLTALQLFEHARVEVAVVEVGMGGRLDATNVIPTECIFVSALTSVELDHQGFLGNTLGDIARQKAGIARSGRPFVFGPQRTENRVEVDQAVAETVGANGAKLVGAVDIRQPEDRPLDVDFSLRPLSNPQSFCPPSGSSVEFTIPAISPESISAVLPLQGKHQLENLSTALGIVQALKTSTSSEIGFTSITSHSVQQGISSVHWRGRLSWHPYQTPRLSFPVLVDGAHNAASSRTLSQYIDAEFLSQATQRVHLTYIIALSHSPPKSPEDTLAPLLVSSNAASVSVAFVPFSRPTNMPWVKSVSPAALAGLVESMEGIRVWKPAGLSLEGETLEEGSRNTFLEDALAWAGSLYSTDKEGDQRMVVVAGSLYLVADFYRLMDHQ